MPIAKDEKKALRDSFDVYGKVLIASLQFENELSEHVYDILKSMQEDFRTAGIEFSRGKKEWKWEDSNEGKKWIGIKIPIKKFKDFDVDGKKILYLGVVFNLGIEKDKDVFPYVALSLDYLGNSQKKWQSHFKNVKEKLDKKYKLKPYAAYLYLWPADPDSYRRKSLDEVDKDLKDIVSKFLEVV